MNFIFSQLLTNFFENYTMDWKLIYRICMHSHQRNCWSKTEDKMLIIFCYFQECWNKCAKIVIVILPSKILVVVFVSSTKICLFLFLSQPFSQKVTNFCRCHHHDKNRPICIKLTHMRQKPFTISLPLTKNTNTRTSFTNRHLAGIRRKQRVLTRRRTATASDSGLDGCAECELEATTWSDEMPHKPGRILHCWVPTAPSGNADNNTQSHRLLVKNI